MEFALYRYEFEVKEKKTSSANLFPSHWGNLTPREAFEKKSELLNELLEKDYQMPDTEHSQSYLGYSLPNAKRNKENRVLDVDSIFDKFAAEERTLQKHLPTDLIHEKRVPTTTHVNTKPWLQFTNGHKMPLQHKQVTAPREGFAILQLALCSRKIRHPRPFHAGAVKENDYHSLYIIIDNRGTNQRVAIEVKPSVLKETDDVAASLARALSKAFACYGLQVKVVPIRNDKHFWKIVGNKELYPKGFKKLRVVFPHINDPKVTENMKRFNLDYQRTMFGCSNFVSEYNAPQGEKLEFNEDDEKQRLLMEICNTVGDSVELSPIGGRKLTLGGQYAKMVQMNEAERKTIEESNKLGIDLFGNDLMEPIKTFMDKAY